MTYLTGLRGAVCATALIAGGMAHADVTAQQVWDDWKAQMSLNGDEGISIGSEESSGGTVTVRDLSINFSDDEITVESQLGDLIFEEQGDGSVNVVMAESYPIVITGEDGVVVTIEVSQENGSIVVSGDPDAMNYAISADTYTFALVDIVDGDVTFTGDARAVASDINGNYTVNLGDMREVDFAGTLDTLDILVDVQVPGGNGEYVTAAAKYSDFDISGSMVGPLDMEEMDPENPFADGLAFNGGYRIGSGEFVIDVNADGDQVAASGSIGTTQIVGEISSDVMAYDASANDLTVSVQTSQFPLPIDFSLGEYGVNFRMPTGAAEEASDFAIGFDLVDLALSDSIWGIFDPGAMLPRDPATIQLGITGTARALVDIFDPAAQASMDRGQPPFELESAVLETLNISVAGATVVGDGSFTFDNTDMQTFAPLPAPEGQATVEISGLNGLLDNLVAAGLVPEDQVMAPRMMMGMFMRNTGDDQMETTVEVSPNGEVKVNGNRVR